MNTIMNETMQKIWDTDNKSIFVVATSDILSTDDYKPMNDFKENFEDYAPFSVLPVDFLTNSFDMNPKQITVQMLMSDWYVVEIKTKSDLDSISGSCLKGLVSGDLFSYSRYVVECKETMVPSKLIILIDVDMVDYSDSILCDVSLSGLWNRILIVN